MAICFTGLRLRAFSLDFKQEGQSEQEHAERYAEHLIASDRLPLLRALPDPQQSCFMSQESQVASSPWRRIGATDCGSHRALPNGSPRAHHDHALPKECGRNFMESCGSSRQRMYASSQSSVDCPGPDPALLMIS